jgi:hypothetical protein
MHILSGIAGSVTLKLSGTTSRFTSILLAVSGSMAIGAAGIGFFLDSAKFPSRADQAMEFALDHNELKKHVGTTRVTSNNFGFIKTSADLSTSNPFISFSRGQWYPRGMA